MNNQPIEAALQGSSLHVLLMLVSKTLTRAGFGDVQMLDRRQNRQKSRLGGCELLCQTNLGTVPIKVVVKVVKDTVRVRMLDELTGVVARTGSNLGVLVTPYHASQKERGPQDVPVSREVHVLDGKSLATLMGQFKIGVRPSGEPDYAFFAEMEEQSERVLDFIASTPR